MIIRNKNMGCFNLVLIAFIYLFSFSDLLISIEYTSAQPIYAYHFCLGDNYTTNSTFSKNLNLLLPSLSSVNPSVISNGYYNNTVGRNPDMVYGSLQCRGDISLEDCQDCVKVATEDINTDEKCRNSKQAIIFYYECLLRYSNQNYFTTMQDKPGIYLLNTKNISNPDQFRPVRANLLIRIAGEAVSSNGSINFATGDTNFTNRIKVYGLVQCTADIPSGSCYQCLFAAISEIPNCCDGSQGGRVVRPSCNWRYEIYPFFKPQLPPATNTTAPNENGNDSSKLAISIVVPSVIIVLSAIAFWFFCLWRKKTKTKKLEVEDVNDEVLTTDSLQLNFATVSAATDNFSESNKLGEGGCGSVYKGTLSDGQEIAVKRLSKNSGQGEQEFKNEVTLVAKLQHRYLVKLVGFSLAAEEKLLIYEFMPNASLDQFLFDPVKSTQLDWERRYRIIGGVARGLVYLHEESRLKIVHRDLKASNILLDKDMNPKIADFGMARLFVLDQIQANTNRIVGTYGYMAPEYVMHGEFSVKSDVFSFGVLVLEILCGQRNSSFHKSDIARDLLSYAWKHWNNGSALEILAPTLKDACSRTEVMRCIHVALLCVQENVADRPSMPAVVQMLSSYSAVNPDLPSAPAFFAGSPRYMEPKSTSYIGSSEEHESSSKVLISEAVTWSITESSVTEPYPR